MTAVGYEASAGDTAELLIEEARQRQRRRRTGLAAAIVLAGVGAAIFLIVGRGSGSGGRPAVKAGFGSSAVSIVKVANAPAHVSGALTITVVPDWGSGEKITPTITDQGTLINRGRKPVYVDGRPLVLLLQTVVGRNNQRIDKPNAFVLRAAPNLRLAGIGMSNRDSIFVLASSKRPPFSFRNVPGRRLALWYSLDGGSQWRTASWAITKASAGGPMVATPHVQGLNEKTAVERLTEQGLIPEVKHTHRCSICTGERVLRQDPAPGRRISRWSRVTMELVG